jgi:hypothetical protein
VTSLALPDGTAVIAAAGDDGGLRWWDAPTGRLISGAALDGAAPVLSLAPVLMPALPGATTEIAARLAGLRDGRTALAAGDTAGVVRLWDPATCMPVTELFQRPGRRVASMTAVNFVNHPPWHGTDLVAVYDDLLVDVWESGSVHSSLSTMAPGTGKLAAVGHRHLTGAGVSPRRLGPAGRSCSPTGTARCQCGRPSASGSATRCRPTRHTARSPASPCCPGRPTASPS